MLYGYYELSETEKVSFTGAYITVTTQPGENRIVYERAYFRPGICVIPVVDGRLRFVKERTWDRKSELRVKCCSGYIDDCQSPVVCARNELVQELGLGSNDVMSYHVAEESGAINKRQYYFLARNSTVVAMPTLEDDEHIVGHEDLTRDELRSRVLAGEFGTGRTAFALMKLVLEALL